jgi:glycosyltransferase involved in cell wall biosynthesis
VSIVVPVLDEARHLEAAVHAVLAQGYPGAMEVVLALGPSKDDTDAVAADLVAHDSRVRTVKNASGRTPDALNAALAVASYDVIARVDGHAELSEDYLRIAVEALRATGADNVGGMMAATGRTAFEHAVACAMRSRLGVGAAPFHTGGDPGPAETVYLGVFRRQTLVSLGGYDTTFVRAQDWELNHRIRAAGGLVWFTPALQVTYRPRARLQTLARQYFDYGRWRREVMRTHEGTVALRYLAPPATLSLIAAGWLAVAAGVAVGGSWWWIGLLPSVGYAAGVLAGSLWVGRRLEPAARLRLPLVLGAMHMSWATGFITSPRGLRPTAS